MLAPFVEPELCSYPSSLDVRDTCNTCYALRPRSVHLLGSKCIFGDFLPLSTSGFDTPVGVSSVFPSTRAMKAEIRLCFLSAVRLLSFRADRDATEICPRESGQNPACLPPLQMKYRSFI